MIIHMVSILLLLLIMIIQNAYSKKVVLICPRDNDCQHQDYSVNPPQTPLPLLTTETSWLGGRTLKVIVKIVAVIVINTILFLISIAINITIDIIILIVTFVITLFSDPKQGRVSKPSEGRWTGKSHRPKQ